MKKTNPHGVDLKKKEKEGGKGRARVLNWIVQGEGGGDVTSPCPGKEKKNQGTLASV